MSIWFLLNGALLIWALWNVIESLAVHTAYYHFLLGFAGFLFFIFNWTRNAVFATIRGTKDRQKKIRLAKISKKVMPYHRWTGTLSIVFILLHGAAVLYLYNFDLTNMKILTGLPAALTMLALVLSGWYSLLIRHDLMTRNLHRRLGLSLFILVVLHLAF
ncbi:MAG TPA: hypothetical protein H9994_09010 [Candidatus Salinicoccus merdavium]|nr:hypothetical protein [Candidatus Salinicoccus merdavium]